MKKRTEFLFVLVLILFSVLAGASSSAEIRYWTLLPNTSVFQDTDTTSNVVIVLRQNEEVTLSGETVTVDGVVWQKITYNGYVSGYVPYNKLYYTEGSFSQKITRVKINPSSMGEEVPLYKVPTPEGEKVLLLNDGQEVYLIESGISYGDFCQVEYNGETYFVIRDNVTSGLTKNQLLAVILCSCLVGFGGGITILFVVRKKKNARKERIA